MRQPANTWSNLGFVAVGLVLILQGLRKKSDSDLLSGLCILFMGSSSFMAHASNTDLFGFLDVASILVYLAFLVAALMQRAQLSGTLFFLNHRLFTLRFFFERWLGLSLLLVTFYFLLPRSGMFLLGGIGAPLLISELIFVWKNKANLVLNHIYPGIAFLAAGLISLLLDATKTVCEPINHLFQLHALWHIFAAAGTYFLTLHLTQFQLLLIKRRPLN